MDIDEFLIHSTIRIESIRKNGAISTGTGFFFTFFENQDQQVPLIVTNNHVIEDCQELILRFSVAENGIFKPKDIFTFSIKNIEDFVIHHPDLAIDLCVIKIASLLNYYNKNNKQLYFTTYTKKDIPTNDYIQNQLSNVEDINVVGYPDGIWDSINNLPVVRKGITATSIKYDFEDTPKFLIDSAIFGGSSGSPVLIFNQGAYTVKNTLYAGGRIKLVGIVYAVAQHKVNGEIKIVEVPTDTKKPISETNIPNNLGVVIKANKILDFEKFF